MDTRSVLAALCAVATISAADPATPSAGKAAGKTKGWIEDFAKAKAEAAAHRQPIFAFFTGSDWCGWCMRLHAEVLDQKAFKEFAEANLVLFEADFPQSKKLSKETQRQNAALAAQYQVRGYPTVFLLDADGKVLGQTGYQRGGAEAYVKHLRELLEKAGVKADSKAPAPAAPVLSPFEKLKAQQAAKAKVEADAKAKADAEAKAKTEADAKAKADETPQPAVPAAQE